MTIVRADFYNNIEFGIVSERIYIDRSIYSTPEGERTLHSTAIYFSRLRNTPLPNFRDIQDIIDEKCIYSSHYAVSTNYWY